MISMMLRLKFSPLWGVTLLVPRPSLRIPNRTEDIGGSVVPEKVTKEVVQLPKPQLKKAKGIKEINDEMDFIMGNNTRVLADLPRGCKPLGCKWIFKRKLKYYKTADCYGINSQSDYSLDGCEDNFLECKFDESGKGVNICLYVDDMLIFGTDQVQVDLTKEFLSSRFSMKDMGRLMPDIAFAVGKLSRYTSNLGTHHWQAIQRVLKYLKKTIDYSYPSVLEGYTDASWIRNTEDNSSTSGWVFLLGGGTISWDSKKQTCITGSTMESEFVALAAAGKEAEWLRNLILEISLWSKPIAPIYILCDSAATLVKAYSQMYNGKYRHLGVRHNKIRELITNGVVSIEFMRSQ
ncbi:hypothetical protein Tco_0073005 [Tanacetum coccineum]